LLDWNDIKTARRRLEDRIRKDISLLERKNCLHDIEKIFVALENTEKAWIKELADILGTH